MNYTLATYFDPVNNEVVYIYNGWARVCISEADMRDAIRSLAPLQVDYDPDVAAGMMQSIVVEHLLPAVALGMPGHES